MNESLNILIQKKILVSIKNSILFKLTKPRGPILGAREEVAPTSPPTHRKYTSMKNTI